MSVEIHLHQGNIADEQVDVIVNSINCQLKNGGGVNGAIHRAAGVGELTAALTALGNRIEFGEVKVTPAFRLKAKFICHVLAPRFFDDDYLTKLGVCYQSVLTYAKNASLDSIAFPNIGCGAHFIDLAEAAAVAIETVRAWSRENSQYDMKIVFVCFERSQYNLYAQLLDKSQKMH